MRADEGTAPPVSRLANRSLVAMPDAPARPAVPVTQALERETGFEPATPSLEGWRSTAELFPPVDACDPPSDSYVCAPEPVVGRGGFEPPKAYASRFTVCPLWPLGYLPEAAGMRWNPRPRLSRKCWRWREDLNPRPTAYKAVALPLSYASTDKTSL